MKSVKACCFAFALNLHSWRCWKCFLRCNSLNTSDDHRNLEVCEIFSGFVLALLHEHNMWMVLLMSLGFTFVHRCYGPLLIEIFGHIDTSLHVFHSEWRFRLIVTDQVVWMIPFTRKNLSYYFATDITRWQLFIKKRERSFEWQRASEVCSVYFSNYMSGWLLVASNGV